MKYLSLNLDTRYNIFRGTCQCILDSLISERTVIVGASLHAMFDNSMWMLVPEEDTINRFLSSIRRHGDKWYAIRSAFPKFQVCFVDLFRGTSSIVANAVRYLGKII